MIQSEEFGTTRDSPWITWIMPVKNGAPFLEECLKSIAQQTYTHWTLLVWNDDSTDDTLEILNDWIPAKIPGKVFSGKVSCVGEALHNLVNLAETELVARIDADDINYVRRLEKQVKFMLKNPEVSVLGTNAVASPTGECSYFPHSHVNIHHYALDHNPLLHPSVMFRRSHVLDVGNYRNFIMEDYDLWLRMLTKYKFECLPEALLYYRRHPAQITAKPIFKFEEEVFYQSSHVLWGCSAVELFRLRNRKSRLSIPLYFKIAFSLERNSPYKLGYLKRLLSLSLLSVFTKKSSRLDRWFFWGAKYILVSINRFKTYLKRL